MVDTSEQIRRELGEIERRNNGILRAEDVVNFARDEKTALHTRFTWDDSEAAHQYRLEQARYIIRVTVMVLPNDNKPTRVYVSLPPDRQEPRGGYRSLVSVMSNAEQRAQLLAEARREMDYFRQKYRHLVELQDVITAMNKALAKPVSKSRKPRLGVAAKAT